jgi:hypothetical protein
MNLIPKNTNSVGILTCVFSYKAKVSKTARNAKSKGETKAEAEAESQGFHLIDGFEGAEVVEVVIDTRLGIQTRPAREVELHPCRAS